jgi:hypothetical protein
MRPRRAGGQIRCRKVTCTTLKTVTDIEYTNSATMKTGRAAVGNRDVAEKPTSAMPDAAQAIGMMVPAPTSRDSRGVKTAPATPPRAPKDSPAPKVTATTPTTHSTPRASRAWRTRPWSTPTTHDVSGASASTSPPDDPASPQTNKEQLKRIELSGPTAIVTGPQ